MSHKHPKSTVVAFKVEEELADFLNQLPNKSDFIRRAIYSQLGVSCPLCRGTGKVSKETHDQFSAFLEKWDLHHCEGCGDEFALPKEAADLPSSLRALLESVLKGGPEYCYTCYTANAVDEHDETSSHEHA
jgi:hypothetical protein